jgi:succinate-semialdehyde dehydrogenase / glutarate-semialdehyde dehydrogenase
MAYQSLNPYDERVFKTFDEHSDDQLEARVEVAQRCFETWQNTTFAERAAILKRAATILRSRVENFARPVTLEMGKLISESRGEVNLSADILEYYADHAEEFLAPQELKPATGSASIESAPLGVLFGIEPWNFPYYQLARFVAPNLMAGNVVMVKHSSSVPQCAVVFADLFIEAGAPEGAYTNLRINKQQIAKLIADPRIKGVALTGSEEAGASVAELAGKALKKTTMELGGSDAFIVLEDAVLEDADLEATIKWAVWGRVNNGGQCCVAAKRFIVLESVADRFLEKFVTAMNGLKTGDPMNEATTLAPMSSKEALQKLLEQINRAVEHGARAVIGGKAVEGIGAFMQPTILTDISPENPAYREEFFGPVALCFRVANEDAAIALANDSSFGLGGSVFTKDIERGKRIARRIETGMVFINHPTWTAPDLPFGGIKLSGYGRELSSLGIQEFVNKKLIRVSDINAPA